MDIHFFPIQNSIFLILGMFLIFGRLIGRLLSFEKLNLNFMIYGETEKKNLIYLFFFVSFQSSLSIIVFNISLVNSWIYLLSKYIHNLHLYFKCLLYQKKIK